MITFASLVIQLTPREEQENVSKPCTQKTSWDVDKHEGNKAWLTASQAQSENNPGTVMSWPAVRQSRAQIHCPSTTCTRSRQEGAC